ncbi:hypothetical protein RchiOBHm_Chr5g0019021 [Rosa chinensis]|uniref:Uncharacterized protein n=1 Tax=Rosa chinensis TaxID=74649 RepID=A0A2P6Q6W9_ROSCH|nr:hypothetical protein RchiOBHm_Chr5g0019021 [Rosa chinensis]
MEIEALLLVLLQWLSVWLFASWIGLCVDKSCCSWFMDMVIVW